MHTHVHVYIYIYIYTGIHICTHTYYTCSQVYFHRVKNFNLYNKFENPSKLIHINQFPILNEDFDLVLRVIVRSSKQLNLVILSL